MKGKQARNKPSARCVRCGHEVVAEDHAEVHRSYSQHVINQHGLPGHATTAAEAEPNDMAPAPVAVDE